MRVPLRRSTKVHFSRESQRQVRERVVNHRGEIKLFGKQIYISSALARATVLVRLSDRQLTIYHGDTVVRRRLPALFRAE